MNRLKQQEAKFARAENDNDITQRIAECIDHTGYPRHVASIPNLYMKLPNDK